jgi:cell division protease FtsH
MVGADLENLVNEAAILAARRNKRTITMTELVESIERVMAGPARRSRVLDDNDRRIVAYHEAGWKNSATPSPSARSPSSAAGRRWAM